MAMLSLATKAASVLRFVAPRRSVLTCGARLRFIAMGWDFTSRARKTLWAGSYLRGRGAHCSCRKHFRLRPDGVRIGRAVSACDDRCRRHGCRIRAPPEAAPVAISRDGLQRLREGPGGACAFKFRDPDGHPVELIEFAPGQGVACWSAASQRDSSPTLGIDHAAIRVSQAERSIAFYERLGFRPASRQINRGVDQARLDGLSSTEVEIEVGALVPPQAATPHLELLIYRTPGPTRGDAPVHVSADWLVWQAHAAQDRSRLIAGLRQEMVITDPVGHRNWIAKWTQKASTFRA